MPALGSSGQLQVSPTSGTACREGANEDQDQVGEGRAVPASNNMEATPIVAQAMDVPPPCELDRGKSFMQEVQERIEEVRSRRDSVEQTLGIPAGSISERAIGTSRRQTRTSALSASFEVGESKRRRGCNISFRTAVLGSMAVSVVLACAAMFLLVEIFTEKFKRDEQSGCESRVQLRLDLIDGLAYEQVTKQQYKIRLKSIAAKIEEFVTIPADRALDAVWGSMLTQQHANASWTGTTPHERKELAYRSWVELSRAWSYTAKCNASNISCDLACRPRVTGLFVGFRTGEYAGFSLQGSYSKSSYGCPLPRATLWDAPVARENGSSLLMLWNASVASGAPITWQQQVVWDPNLDPAYAVQVLVSSETPAASEQQSIRVWSNVTTFADSGEVGLSRTAPVAYCGRYSCFSGVVGARIRLQDVASYCSILWTQLQVTLALQTPPVRITNATSSIYIVNQVSELFPNQQGILLASSGSEAPLPTGVPPQAAYSSQPIVRAASTAILRRFQGWNDSALQQPAGQPPQVQEDAGFFFAGAENGTLIFNFSRGRTQSACEPDHNPLHTDCFDVGVISMRIDDHTRWLGVIVLPAGTFGVRASETRTSAEQQMVEMSHRFDMIMLWSRVVSMIVVLVVVTASVVIGLLLGITVSKPLHRLSVLMRKLVELDFAHDSPEFAELQWGRRCGIRDVRELQQAFRRLSLGTEAFARFVPETVVRNIIHGDTSATELQVRSRNITIMNSDIEGFTAISESLSQRDLLFVLTRYLSVMTRVVELYDGVVSEIQGDGLIVFWNAPDDVEDHGSKACAASLAQQHAVSLLGAEFATLDLPSLSIRIGIHTGLVRTGNIGSERKMKFGCLGEPMKVAGVLQEMCKPYGVQVICSDDTYASVVDHSGFFCRRLDKVRVKGSGQETWIYEVLGCEPGVGEDGRMNPESGAGDDNDFRRSARSATSNVASVASEAVLMSIAAQSERLWTPESSPIRGFRRGTQEDHTSRDVSATTSTAIKVASHATAPPRPSLPSSAGGTTWRRHGSS